MPGSVRPRPAVLPAGSSSLPHLLIHFSLAREKIQHPPENVYPDNCRYCAAEAERHLAKENGSTTRVAGGLENMGGRRRRRHTLRHVRDLIVPHMAVPPAVFSTGGTIEPGDTDRNQPHRSTASCAHTYPCDNSRKHPALPTTSRQPFRYANAVHVNGLVSEALPTIIA